MCDILYGEENSGSLLLMGKIDDGFDAVHRWFNPFSFVKFGANTTHLC
jgi:hypothetical protein